MIDNLVTALRRIVMARDTFTSTGAYPLPPEGPDQENDDVSFDDWAADVAESALETYEAQMRLFLEASNAWRNRLVDVHNYTGPMLNR